MKLENNNIYVTSTNTKNNLLRDLSKENNILNIKFITLKELIESLTFSYDERLIAYIMDEYNLKYLNAKTIVNNIKFIENKNYNIKKLDELVKIKKEVESLLIYDNLFKKLIKNRKVIFYNCGYISKFDKKIIKKIKNSEIINEEKNEFKHNVYELNDIVDEIEFVSVKICELIKNNIDINSIKLINVDSSYTYILKKIFKMHNIPLNLDLDISIYETNLCKKYLKLFEEDKDINDLEYNKNDEKELEIYNAIINILNKYNFKIKKHIKKEMLINDFKKCKLKSKTLTNAVNVTNIDDINNEDYVFLLNFNQETIPKIYKDEDYLSDNLKEILGLERSFELNKIEREKTIEKIKSIKNLVITYKLSSSFSTFYPSSLIKDLGYEVVKVESINNTYSNIYNKIKLTKRLDNYIKFNEVSSDLNNLYTSYKDINYLTYNNKFKGINNDLLLEYLNNNLTLSYTSMNNFYECKFKYYLSSILRINENEITFAQTIGNLFHYILSICFNDNFDFEYEFNNYIKEFEFSVQNKFFLKKLKEELKFIIKTIEKQYSFSDFKDAYYENEINVVNKFNNVTVTFKGFIDKILYKNENGKTLAVIIDYKTGSNELSLNNSIYGLNLQLPVYLYLINNKIENVSVVGFYLQKILNSEISIKENKTYEKQKEENLRLNGYTINDEKLIYIFDKTYKDSSVIKSMKIGNDGFSRYSKVLSENEMINLSNLVDDKIKEASNEIINGDFKINPKKIGFKNISCTFCKYKDICFMKEDDSVVLEERKDFDFLK